MPSKVKTPPRPLGKPEVCEVPKQNETRVKKKKAEDVWKPAIDAVRAANGRTVKICVHPRARNIVVPLRKMFPDIEFATRTVPVDRGTSYGIWAWVKFRITDGPPDPPPPQGLPPNGAQVTGPAV